jgi:putative hydrolase of the HAD superfamily
MHDRTMKMTGSGRDLGGVEVWVFDLDNTLYPASCRLFDQVEQRIGEFVAAHLGLDAVEARRVQKQYFHTYGTTMRGMMEHHGVTPDAFLDYVHAIDLSPVMASPALDTALDRLPGRKVVFTNGSTAHAERVLGRLGVRHHFDGIFDIVAADYVPKPEPVTYDRMVARHGIAPRRAAMLDDLPRNLAPAAAMGMTTVLVKSDGDGAEDGAEGDHIHHVTDDLVAWLEAAAPGPGAKSA